MKITGHDLIKRGWLPGVAFGLALARGNSALDAGGDEAAAWAAIGEPPTPAKAMPLRDEPIILQEAIGEPTNEEERNNLLAVRSHMSQLLRVPIVTAAAIMPDCCPAGPEPIVVGGVVATEGAIIPAAHSADVCCSMMASFFAPTTEQARQMDLLMSITRFGQGGRPEETWEDHPILEARDDKNPFLKGLGRYACIHLADQGDGNHFAYLGRMELTSDFLLSLARAGHGEIIAPLLRLTARPLLHVLVTHHGSRGLGAQVYKRGKEAAEDFATKLCPAAPHGTEWIPHDTDEGRAYWSALEYVERWTEENHTCIHNHFLMDLRGDSRCMRIFNAHNFVWKRGDTFLHGKGATPAWLDPQGLPLLGLIPLNMAQPILLVAGSDNKQFLSFAPHGAGRNRSRTQTLRNAGDAAAQEQAFRAATKGLDIRWFSGKMDFAESPVGYKDAATIRREIESFGLAKVLGEITPYGCIMAGEQPEPFWKKKQKEIT